MSSSKRGIMEKDYFYFFLMVAIIIAFCGRLVFTDQIIRASDVVSQFIWSAKAMKEQPLLDYLRSVPDIFRASWDPLSDGGRTLEGGWNAIGLLFHRYLILHFLPFPASIAWLAVIALCWGSIGTFRYCRLIGIGSFGAFAAGLIFVLCTENSSLINAGHIQKLESICWFPWVMLFMEKALRSGRPYHYALTALMLAIQFFHMHWQISFYTCMTVALYWSWHTGAQFLSSKNAGLSLIGRNLLLASMLVLLFFSTIAMSFAPLVSWSQQSERGDAVAGTAAGGKGANRGGGIGYEEGMSWSLPPEEILTFLVPGMFGYSRQEGGDKTQPGQVYYWGRMRFTQTGDYLGLLPWFLLPLPLIFRRDRYTWFFTAVMALALVMALGKYTFIYRFMFDYLPAFSKFRVPKMILFLFAFAASVLTGKGIDILYGAERERKKLLLWLGCCGGVVALTALLTLFVRFGGQAIVGAMGEYLAAPTRYQSGPQLASQRYVFMLRESAIAFVFALSYLAVIIGWFRKWLPSRTAIPLLAVILLCDLWRVDQRYFVVAPPPVVKTGEAKNDIVEFLKPRIGHYRMQPLNEENAHFYADNGLANISAYVTISERRYREFLNNFTLTGAMPDIMNLRYIVVPATDLAGQSRDLAAKYRPVFYSSKGSVVLENRTVLPKAWLVPSVLVVDDPQQRLRIMAFAPDFNPAMVALVETRPPVPLAPYGKARRSGSATVESYEPNRITVNASALTNCLLILGEKYYRWWNATVDGKEVEIFPVNHVLRGVYLTPGQHRVEFIFDPLPFKFGKWLTLASLAVYGIFLGKELWLRKQ